MDNISAALSLLKRDLYLAYQSPSELFQSLIFFILVALLFPLSVGPETILLKQIGNGMIWVGALLSSLLSLDYLFSSDYKDGSLEQWMLSPTPTTLLVLAKIMAHWLVTGLPVVVISPFVVVMFHLPFYVMIKLMLVLMTGTLLFSFIGSIAAALTLGVQKKTLLLGLLAIPLYIPVLILGTACINTVLMAMPWWGYLLWLWCLLVLALTLTPFAVSASLSIALAES